MKYLFLILMLSLIGCGGDGGDDAWSGNWVGSVEWSDASTETMTYDEAIDYCEDMGKRLPTIDELRTLIQNCSVTETGGACAVTNSCAGQECWSEECWGCYGDYSGKYSVFGDTHWFWSSTTYTYNTDYARYVDFSNGGVYYDNKTNSNFVRCVR